MSHTLVQEVLENADFLMEMSMYSLQSCERSENSQDPHGKQEEKMH